MRSIRRVPLSCIEYLGAVSLGKLLLLLETMLIGGRDDHDFDFLAVGSPSVVWDKWLGWLVPLGTSVFTAAVRRAYSFYMKVRYVYWREDDYWLGYLEEFSEYWTQGESLEDLKENLRDLYEDLSNDRIPEVRRTAELEVN